jgi:hypothetical protein
MVNWKLTNFETLQDRSNNKFNIKTVFEKFYFFNDRVNVSCDKSETAILIIYLIPKMLFAMFLKTFDKTVL